MRDRNAADDKVQGAFNRALLDIILPPMRNAALDAGYTLAVHGSLNRDIDLIAVPWAAECEPKEELADRLIGAAGGVIKRACKQGEWAEKPHGRQAIILLAFCGENSAFIDLSVMPILKETIHAD
jgi:hypothetical protein